MKTLSDNEIKVLQSRKMTFLDMAFSMPNDALGKVHTIRSLLYVLSEISEQSLLANCLRAPFEMHLQSLYPCDDEEFGETTTNNINNDCVTGLFCRPCLMHERM